MKLKNRILLILVILMAFICLNATNSFAAWTGSLDEDTYINYTGNSTTVDFNANPYKILFTDTLSGYHYLIMSDDTFTIRNRTEEDDVILGADEPSTIICQISNSSTNLLILRIHRADLTYSEETNTYTISDFTGGSSSCQVIRQKYNGAYPLTMKNSDGSAIDYSKYSTDVLSNLGGNAVFPQPPQGTILAPIVEEVETEKTLVQVVGILPIVLIVIVSLIAIRKALQLLAKILTKA